MSDYRQSLRSALDKNAKKYDKKNKREDEEGEENEELTLAESVAHNIQLMIWPERATEIKRQRKIQEIQEEARDGTG